MQMRRGIVHTVMRQKADAIARACSLHRQHSRGWMVDDTLVGAGEGQLGVAVEAVDVVGIKIDHGGPDVREAGPSSGAGAVD